MQRFRRRNQDIGRLANQALALDGRRVPSANRDFDRWQAKAHTFGGRSDTNERQLEIAMNVVVKGFQWRNVENLNAARDRILPPQPVETSEKRGERLARAGRREQKRTLACGNRGPALFLDGRWRADLAAKPSG